MRRTVERVGHAERQAATDRDEHAARHAAGGGGAGLDGGAGEHDQVGDLAALQRQLQDRLVVHDRADARAADVDERRRGLHGDRLLERAHGERRIDRRRPAHLQDDARLHVGPESLERDLEPVGPGRKVRQHVAARVIGHGRANEARVGLRHGDGHAGQHGAAFVANRTTQLRCPLRPRGADGQQKDQCAVRTGVHPSLHEVNSSRPRTPQGESERSDFRGCSPGAAPLYTQMPLPQPEAERQDRHGLQVISRFAPRAPALTENSQPCARRL